MGFNAEWGVLSAADVGAKHERERIWILAEQRNILSHTYNRNEWWKQQQESTSKTDIEISNANNSVRGGGTQGEQEQQIQQKRMALTYLIQ
jgi:site-specific DNA-cytosine methylase